MVSYFLPTKALLNNFRELEELVFFDLWIPDSGFRIPDSGFWFLVPIPDSGFRFPGFRVARLQEVFASLSAQCPRLDSNTRKLW